MFISPRCVDAGVLSDDGHAGGYNDDGDILWSTDATHETLKHAQGWPLTNQPQLSPHWTFDAQSYPLMQL